MRSSTLEPHDQFEGVGAHEFNPRWDDADGTGYDSEITLQDTPALVAARQSLLAAADTSPGQLHGADTSHYQVTQGGGVMNIGSGLWWWVHKATQSTGYQDRTLPYALKQMVAAGVELPGTYHWGSPATDPVKQAANWLGHVGGDYMKRLFFMGDMEESGLTVAQVLAIYETVERVTKKPCSHYTGLYVSGGSLYTDDRIRDSKYGPRPIVVAAYITRTRLSSLVATQGKGKPWHAWQYSSNGPVPDVAGRCDMDEVRDKQAFTVSLHGAQEQHPDVTPPPVPIITVETDMPIIITAPGRNPAQLDGAYAVGLSDETLKTTKLAIEERTTAEWDEIVAISDAKKMADRARSVPAEEQTGELVTATHPTYDVVLGGQTVGKLTPT